MQKHFISSRKGGIKGMEVCRYDLTDSLQKNRVQRQKFYSWLSKQTEIPVYEIKDTCFFTFTKMPDVPTWQYRANKSISIGLPFQETQTISRYIGHLLRTFYCKNYQQYLNQNAFSINEIDVGPFKLKKCFEFNVELFSDGTFYIHFQPISKITSPDKVDLNFIELLKCENENRGKTGEMKFYLTETKRFFKLSFDLLDKDVAAKATQFISTHENVIATFDYHFVASFSPNCFGKLTENTIKKVDESVNFLRPIAAELVLPDFIELFEKAFTPVTVKHLSKGKNLLVGTDDIPEDGLEEITVYSKNRKKYGARIEYSKQGNAERIVEFLKDETTASKVQLDYEESPFQVAIPKTFKVKIEQRNGWKSPHITGIATENSPNFLCNQQSAAYHKGMFRPVTGKTILPLVIGELDISLFGELLARFNKGGTANSLKKPICIGQNDELPINGIINVLREVDSGNFLLAVFSKYVMPKDYFHPLKKKRVYYQIYQAEMEKFKLSNFTVMCLEKLGGLLCVIADTFENDNTYFIGLDLGHSTKTEIKFSNLAAVVFNNKGELVAKWVVKNVNPNEALSEDSLIKVLSPIKDIIASKRLPKANRLMFHRDGKIHKTDINNIAEAVQKVFGISDFEVVEIVKSGFPVFANYDESKKEYLVNEPGTCWVAEDKTYALLTTNTQATQIEALPRPIIVRHKYGDKPFEQIIEQVYWFTKIYTNNLYNSTRLPATTLKANNVVGTSLKEFRSTYLSR